jgi:hypothetical protein
VRCTLLALIAALFALAAMPSQAHRISTHSGPPPAGVSIPSLTHGQMAVIHDNLPAIRALASARAGFDLTTWRLEDYLNLQSFACLWGIVPRSITDENSPFNECAHAYLAAGRALLVQLAHEPAADRKAIDALVGKIEVEMLADGASMNLCRYSDEPFNTNEVIWPHWSMVPFHPPTAIIATTVLATLGVTVWGAWPRRNVCQLRQGAKAKCDVPQNAALHPIGRRRSLTETFAVHHSGASFPCPSSLKHRSFQRRHWRYSQCPRQEHPVYWRC